MEQLQGKIDKFNGDLLKVPFVKQLSDQTKLPPSVFALAIITISVLLVAFNLPFSHLVVGIVGVIYPSCKSLEAMSTDDTFDDDKQWLTYWIVFSLFITLEQSFSWVVCYIPMYFLIKLLILIWLQNPLTLGATLIYKMYVGPFAKKYEQPLEMV